MIFLLITLWQKSVAFGAFTIILCLLLAWQLYPIIGGVEYQTGAEIISSGNITTVTNTYSDYSNSYLATTFMLIVLFLSMQIITFRKDKKSQEQEDGL